MFRFYAGLATKPQGQTYEVGDPNLAAETVREPIGGVARSFPGTTASHGDLETRTWARRGNLLHPQALGTYPSLGSSTFRIDRRSRISSRSCPTRARCGRSGGLVAHG